MAAPEFEGTLVPEEIVERTMTIVQEEGFPMVRFTEEAKARILERLPAGATYAEGGDHEAFQFNDQRVMVLLDFDRLDALGHLVDPGVPSPDTPENVLRQNVIVLAEGPRAGRAALEQTVLETMDVAPAGQGEAPRDAEGGRKRRKSRKTKKRTAKKRKTLRRRRVA